MPDLDYFRDRSPLLYTNNDGGVLIVRQQNALLRLKSKDAGINISPIVKTTLSLYDEACDFLDRHWTSNVDVIPRMLVWKKGFERRRYEQHEAVFRGRTWGEVKSSHATLE